MNGDDSYNKTFVSTVRLGEFSPTRHPLCPSQAWMNEALAKADAKFLAMYKGNVNGANPRIALEQLMWARQLQFLCSIRSERRLVEQITYKWLLRGLVDLTIGDTIWDHSVSSKSCDRLTEFDVVTELFDASIELAANKWLLSGGYFLAGCTLGQTWASRTSPQRKEGSDHERPLLKDFRGEKRTNPTHASTTDRESWLYRKSSAVPTQLSYLRHVLTDSRHGLVVNVSVSAADGYAEQSAAATVRGDVACRGVSVAVGVDKRYDTCGFVKACRDIKIVSQLTRSTRRTDGSAIGGRTTRHGGNAMRQRRRKCIGQCFGCRKMINPIRNIMVRALTKVDTLYTLTVAAHNLGLVPPWPKFVCRPRCVVENRRNYSQGPWSKTGIRLEVAQMRKHCAHKSVNMRFDMQHFLQPS